MHETENVPLVIIKSAAYMYGMYDLCHHMKTYNTREIMSIYYPRAHYTPVLYNCAYM